MTTSKYLKLLGDKIFALRKEKGLSQEELAGKLKTGHTTIGRIERGETNPTIKTLGKIAKELGVQIEELLKL